jgi:hypothetical protein
MKFDYARIALALDGMPLDPLNRRFANYWLSLWDGDQPPERAAFQPGRVPELLPGIAITEVRPGESVRIRLAGTAIEAGLGMDLTGKDWLALTPPAQRMTRLERFATLLKGAASRNIKRGVSLAGTPISAEEMQFPFAGVGEDGTRLLISHIAWRAGSFDLNDSRVRGAADVATTFDLLSLKAR